MATVLICDDRTDVQDQLRRVVGVLPGVEVEVAASCAEALQRRSQRSFDLVLVSLELLGRTGVEAVRDLLGLHPVARVVLLTSPDEADLLDEALTLGAAGYVCRSTPADEFAAAIATALTLAALPVQTDAGAGGHSDAGSAVVLTEREWQVLTGMSLGKSKAEIGRDLFVSEDTVKTHARHLFRKLQVADRAHAVAAGFRRGLLR
ncbi:MAG TPA: response regulator transcription factor [Mycobacteriales bacterium]|nr:response regulator transcription factor [Mycobacteriales bacterium]